MHDCPPPLSRHKQSTHLRRLGGQQTNHQMILKFLDMIVYAINYYLVKTKVIFILTFKLKCCLIFLYRALLLKKINIV